MHTKCAHSLWFALIMAMGLGCGSSDGESSPVDGGATEVDAARTGFPDAGDAAAPPPEMFPELWYAVDSRLVRIELDDAGGVANLSETSISGLHVGHNALTMLDDGSLLGVRLDLDAMTSTFFHIPEPPRGAADPEVAILGIMPDSVMLEALYTDCDGRLYGMDTGEDGTNAVGNRLIRFTGDYLAGDFSYDVISDLGSADVADIDDMGPAIVDGEIVDNPGLAIDTSDVYNFNYETGTGTLAGQGGTWGIHALGGELFSDDTARLYVLSRDAELFEMNPTTYEVGPVLVTGPTDVEGFAGWSGITGPLTECDSGFVIE